MKKNEIMGYLMVAASAVMCSPILTLSAAEPVEIAVDAFEDVVLVDDENCKVVIKGTEVDSLWGYTWKLELENKTDKTLMFSMDRVSVNGYMCDPYWACEVTAGKKANTDVAWMQSDLETNGIETVGEVAFTLKTSDADDYMADPLLECEYELTAPVQEAEPSSEGVSEAESSEAASEEIILAENENCAVKLTGTQTDGMWGYTWNVYLENNTDRTLMFSAEDVTVNDWVCDPYWAYEVAPGKKANVEWNWMQENLDKNGIEEVTFVEGKIVAYDAEDWSAENTLDTTFAVYPLGEEAVTEFVRVPVEGETVLAENEQCTVIITGYEPEGTFGFEMNLYLENKTDCDIMFSIEDAALNGYMCDPYWAVKVPAGKRSCETVSWFETSLEESGITEVETIEGNFLAKDAERYDLEAYVETAFLVNP